MTPNPLGEVRVTDPITGGQKGRKPERYSLLPWEALAFVARVYAFGAKKYADHNWRKGYAWSLSFDALWRHVAAAQSGEWLDDESDLPHLAHAVFHCLTLIVFMLRGLGTDDRACSVQPDDGRKLLELVQEEEDAALEAAAKQIVPAWETCPCESGFVYADCHGQFAEPDPFRTSGAV